MISTALIYFFVGLIALLLRFFSSISLLVPAEIIDNFTLLFSKAHIFDGVFPMTDCLRAILFLSFLWVLLYTVKVLLWVYAMIPVIGRDVHLPQMATIGESTTRNIYDKNGRKLGSTTGRSSRSRRMF